MRSMVVPLGEMASVFSAFGIATCNIMHVYEMSKPILVPFGPDHLNKQFELLETRALAQLEVDGFRREDMALQRFVEMRYKYQVHQVQVPLPGGSLDESEIASLIARFERTYETLYGTGAGYYEAGIELITSRVNAIGRRPNPPVLARRGVKGAGSAAPKHTRAVYWPETRGYAETPIYDGGRLGAGDTLEGPAVIEMATTTILVHPDQRCAVDEHGNVTIAFPV